jgi:hypothetical protein
VTERTEGADVTAESQRLVDEIVALQKEIALGGGDEAGGGDETAGGESAETVGE